MNGLVGCYVSTIGKPHEYFDLTATSRLRLDGMLAAAEPIRTIRCGTLGAKSVPLGLIRFRRRFS